MKPARMCAWCKGFPTTWDLLKALIWPHKVSHTICPTCNLKFMGDV